MAIRQSKDGVYRKSCWGQRNILQTHPLRAGKQQDGEFFLPLVYRKKPWFYDLLCVCFGENKNQNLCAVYKSATREGRGSQQKIFRSLWKKASLSLLWGMITFFRLLSIFVQNKATTWSAQKRVRSIVADATIEASTRNFLRQKTPLGCFLLVFWKANGCVHVFELFITKIWPHLYVHCARQ